MAPTLTVQITPEGQLAIDAQGFAGGACLASTQHLLAALKEAGLVLELTQTVPKPAFALESELTPHSVRQTH